MQYANYFRLLNGSLCKILNVKGLEYRVLAHPRFYASDASKILSLCLSSTIFGALLIFIDTV